MIGFAIISRYTGNSRLSEEEKSHEFSMVRRLTRLALCRIRQELGLRMCATKLLTSAYPALRAYLPSIKNGYI